MTFKEIMQHLRYSEDTKFDLIHCDHPGDTTWIRHWDPEKRVSIVMNKYVYAARYAISDFDFYKRVKESVFKNPYTEYLLWSPDMEHKLEILCSKWKNIDNTL